MLSVRSNRSKRLAVGIALGLATTLGLMLGFSKSAEAYCRTSVCNKSSPGEQCVPAQSSDCGVPLFWAGGCFGFSVNETGSRQVDTGAIEALMQQAFDTWSAAPCGGGPPNIAVSNLGRVECSVQEYNDKSGNANLVVFRDTEWPYAGQGNTLALTTVTYNLDTGEIFDVDLEVNGTSQLTITTSDTAVQYDLLSILTHEAGHMLGLSHSDVADATMKVEYIPGDITLRQLAQDDVDGICAAYPPGQEQGICDANPRRGLQEECGNPQVADDCDCGLPGAHRSAGGEAGFPALLALLLLLRRRRS